jgi:CO/xanthine dehydrogenase Mo-binding subunit
VVAESEAAAEEGCRRLKVDYKMLPAVIDPARAIAPGAPILHPGKTPEQRVFGAARNIVAESHGEYGDVAAALAASAVTYEGTFTTQRVQHAALETHGGLAWVDPDGILNVRSSTQVPFLTRRALSEIFDLAPDKVRVFCERVGGGFGGKQEMFVEDILALAALKTGKPVKLEFTREEQFIASSTRHPMRVTVKAGADTNGKLTALQLDVLSNTGAYGNHAAPVLLHACGECLGVYNCANKKVDAVVAYTNTVPAGAFRGYGLPQTLIAVEAAIDELAKKLGIDPFEFRRRNVVKPGDPMLSPPDNGYHDVQYGSYGLDQCLDMVERAMRADTPRIDLSPEWLVGDGIALTMIDTVPPDGHIADCTISLRDDGGFELTVGTAEFGNGTTTVHRQIAATTLATTVDRIKVRQSDTAHGGHDTGAYGSTGTFVAGRATQAAAENLAHDMKTFAAQAAGTDAGTCVLDNESVLCGGQRMTFAQLAATARSQGRMLAADGNSSGTPRSIAFNVQGFRVAVNKGTGEIKILKSVQAADAGRVANPMQCRGQVEGGVAQSLGAALYEEMVIDEGGRVVNPKFRDYHLPSFADVPRTEVYFAATSDTLGPMGAKSMSESPYNPVAAALGNALADATGIRFTSTPFKPDRLFPLLREKFGDMP